MIQIIPRDFTDNLVQGKAGVGNNPVQLSECVYRVPDQRGGRTSFSQIADGKMHGCAGCARFVGDSFEQWHLLTVNAASGVQKQTLARAGNAPGRCRSDATGGSGDQRYAFAV
jgi:hypothetical protein